MKRLFAAILLIAPTGFAQKWEVSGLAGGGFARDLTVANAAANAAAGFKTGAAFGAALTQNRYRFVSGELRYTYRQNDLKLSNSGTQAGFKGVAHAIHYDVLVHAGPAVSRVRPFASLGAGVKVFRGTGVESSYQPLSSFALLTKTQEWKPLVSVGGGTRFMLGQRIALRVEFRDYITPFPRKVIAPAPGAKVSGWLHDYVPMAGISFTF